MPSVNNCEPTGRQPNPWLALLLVVATAILGALLPGMWLGRNLLMEVVGALASITVFAIFTFIYGGARLVFQHRGLLTALMVASPWLLAALNMWGIIMPAVLTTTDALTGLLVALSIGVTEELLFRGILFRAFRGRSMALYVLVSSITFGLLHFAQGYQGVMATAVVGSSYALARVVGTPLSLLIVCHAVTDLPTLFSQTPHPHYRLVAYGASVLVLALNVAFFLRKTNWATERGEVLSGL
jgi:membrane protease YdiL (CAAX protease family)